MNIDVTKTILFITIIILLVFVVIHINKKPQVELVENNIKLPIDKILREKTTKKKKSKKKYRNTPIPKKIKQNKYDIEPVSIDEYADLVACAPCPPCASYKKSRKLDTSDTSESE